MDYDAIVVGAGPGGYVCAIRLGQLGVKTLIIERDRVGGVCLQRGCIPSKALIRVAGLYRRIQEAAVLGIKVQDLQMDWATTQEWKKKVVDRLTRGIQQLLKGNGVELVEGEAELVDPHRVRVRTPEGDREYTSRSLVLALGSEPVQLPGFEFDGRLIINSTHALSLREIPGRLAVIGGGYIGVELGMVYATLGAKVTVIELMDQILPGTSPDLVRILERRLKRMGMRVFTRARAKDLQKVADGHELVVATESGEVRVPCDKVLVTVGRRPLTRNAGLKHLNLALDEHGFIRVNEKRQTSLPHIYAIGDVAGPPMLAHKASHEGEVVAEVVAGRHVACDYQAVPAVIFTDPEIATVGLTEAQAAEAGPDVVIGRFPFAALGKAQTLNEIDGFVKILAERSSGRVVGAEIVGPEASTLIAELTLAIEMGATVEDLSLTIHAHPTLPEAVMEAAKSVYGAAIHVLNPRDERPRTSRAE